MPIPKKKVYGRGRVATCLFCGDQATSTTGQGAPSCRNHARNVVPDLKCVCGSWLDIREGKWGVFWMCENCGPMNRARVMELHGETIRSFAREQREERASTPRRKEDGVFFLDRIRQKIREGQPLSLDELKKL